MISLAAPYLLVLFIALCFLYILGEFSTRLIFGKNAVPSGYTGAFFRLFVSLIVSVTVYAILKSGGKTIMLFFIPVLLGMAFEWRRLPEPRWNSGNQYNRFNLFGTVMLVSLICFVLGFFRIYVGGEFPFVVYNGNDYAYHAMVSDALRITGYENKFVPEQVMAEGFPGLNLYHFFDLWFSAGLAEITGLTTYVLQLLVTETVILLLIFLGFLAIIEQLFTVRWWHYCLAIIVPFMGHYNPDWFIHFKYLSPEIYRLHHFGTSVMNLPKLLQLVPFAMAAALFFMRTNYVLGAIMLIAVGLTYMSAIPVMIASLFLILLLNFYFHWFSNQSALRILLYLVLYIIFIGAFYKLFGTGLTEGKDRLSLDLLDMAALKTRINIAGLTSIQVIALYTPFILIFLIAVWRLWRHIEKHSVIVFFSVLCIAVYTMGLLGWLATFKNQDGMQLLGNNFPVINMFVLVSFIWLVHFHSIVENKSGSLALRYKLSIGFALLLFLNSAVQTMFGINYSKYQLSESYSEKYKVAVSNLLSSESNLIGVFYKGDQEYGHPIYRDAHRTSQSYKLSWYLVFMPQFYSTTSVSIMDFELSEDPLSRQREVNARSGAQFYNFMQQQITEDKFVSVEISQLQFIEKHNIKYIIASSSAIIPDEIMKLKREELVDSISGERFILLESAE